MAKKKPTLRYYARFKEEFGYLHAVIRYGTTRKCITTPLVITAEQLPRLDTSGYISNPTEGDLLLDGRLHRFTPIVWSVVNPLIANGEFANIPSQTLTAKILEARERDLRDLEQEAPERNMSADALEQELGEDLHALMDFAQEAEEKGGSNGKL